MNQTNTVMLAILVALATTTVIAIAIATISVYNPIALAAKSSTDPARKGLDTADQKIHENTHSTPSDLSKQDLNFHVGTCQGGHSTTVLDQLANGCTLPSPREFHSHP
jgi:hypothetical protein